MTAIHLYYSKIKILLYMLRGLLVAYVIYHILRQVADTDIDFNHLQIFWQTLWQKFLKLDFMFQVLFCVMMGSMLLSIKNFVLQSLKLFENKAQITINAHNISSDLDQISMAWDNIESCHFSGWLDKYPHLKLVYRPVQQNGILRPESFTQNNTPEKSENVYLSLSCLSYDKNELAKLFTELIATHDPVKREILISQFHIKS